MADELEQRIDAWSASGEAAVLIVDGVALVGRVLGRQGALVRFRPWGRSATWIELARVAAAGAFPGHSFDDLRAVTARQRAGLGAVEIEEGA